MSEQKPQELPCRFEVVQQLMTAFGKAFQENDAANAAEFVTACLNAAHNVGMEVLIGHAPLEKREHNRMLLEGAALSLYNALHALRLGQKEIVH